MSAEDKLKLDLLNDVGGGEVGIATLLPDYGPEASPSPSGAIAVLGNQGLVTTSGQNSIVVSPVFGNATDLGAATTPGNAESLARSDHTHRRPTASEIGASAVGHVHTVADVQGFAEAAQDAAAGALIAGSHSGIAIAYTDPDNKISLVNTDGGSAAVSGHVANPNPHSQYLLASQKGDANGVAPLVDNKVPQEYLPSVNQSVSSVFGRSGDVVAEYGDYSTDQIIEAENNVFFTI